MDPSDVLFLQELRWEEIRIAAGDLQQFFCFVLVLQPFGMSHLNDNGVLQHAKLFLPPESNIVDFAREVGNQVLPFGFLSLPKFVQEVCQQDMILPVAVQLFAEVLWVLFKELFQNVVSGVLIMTTKELKKGDLVEIFIDDTVYYGRLEFITLRYTLLRKLDMTRVIIPNKLMTRVPVMTLSAEENVRLKTTFRITHLSELKTLFQSIKQKINSLESITQKEFTLLTLD